MRIACIARCIGVAVFAASLQAGAQPPEGKGKPEHPGASAFVRFPVPQRAVGVLRHSRGTAAGALTDPGIGAHGLNEAASGKAQAVGLGNGLTQNAAPTPQSAERPSGAKPVELALGNPPGGFSSSEKKALLVECGAR